MEKVKRGTLLFNTNCQYSTTLNTENPYLTTYHLLGIFLGCPTFCTTHYLPVCGSDGNNYSNVCSLQSASCRNQKGIKFKHFGHCKGKADILDTGNQREMK